VQQRHAFAYGSGIEAISGADKGTCNAEGFGTRVSGIDLSARSIPRRRTPAPALLAQQLGSTLQRGFEQPTILLR
jgi:hypothetical protein